MAKNSTKSGATTRYESVAKYDAQQQVLARAYGAQADLRRELSDSKSAVAERTEILKIFADCTDSQRAWLLLEDYFDKLSLSRKDFSSHDWWPRLLATQGKKRLEETAILFLRANRSVPSELQPHANPVRFAEIEQAEQEQKLVRQLEHWLFPPTPNHMDAPRAKLRVVCDPQPLEEHSALYNLSLKFYISRPRTGDKPKTLGEVVELTSRAAHEQELFSFSDWEFIQWLAESHRDPEGLWDSLF